jgi:cytoskeleton protein RodZ
MSEGVSNQLPDTEQAHELESVKVTLGAKLAAERKSKEWSIEHVASQLNLAARQIHALETDNYAALPGMASVRGFVRAYAKLLKIDATPLVAMIASEQITPTQPLEPKRQLAAASFSDNRMMSADHRRSSPKAILVAIVVVLLAFGVIVVERMGGWPTLSQSLSSQFKELSSPSVTNTSEQVPPVENANVAATTPEVASAPASSLVSTATTSSGNFATPAASSAVTDEQAAGSRNQVSELTSTPTPTPAPVPASAAPKVDVPPTVVVTAATPAPEKATSVAKGLLVLKVRQDSWVEVKAGKNALISRLMRAGSTEQVEITEAAALTLGNAAGVDVSFRGSPLDIKAEAKNNVVHLSLK